MKKNIKVILFIIISIIFSCILTCIPVKSANLEKPDGLNEGWDDVRYNYREFTGLPSGAEGFNLYYDDMINTAAYLCAWHGGHFFYRQPVILDYTATFISRTWEGAYTAEESWEHFVDGHWEREVGNRDNIFEITADYYNYEDVKECLDSSQVKQQFNVTLEASAYSGKAYYPSVSTLWGENLEDNEGKSKSTNPNVTVTSTGWTRFTVILDHQHEQNNAMSYLLADCADNAGVTPSGSYVNVAFWAQLSARGIGQTEEGSGSPARGAEQISSNIGNVGASSMTRAISATMSEYTDVEKCLDRLKNGEILTEQECNDIYDTAKVNWLDRDAYEMLVVINEYKEDENNAETINKFKELLEKLINDMIENSKDDDLKDERKQNSIDFDGMWDDIDDAGGNYEDTVKDNTTQSNVTVEYNATTQKYLIGPFTIQYTEKYTSDWTLASMAGDPALIVNKNGARETIKKSSGKWNFYYLNGLRVDGIPGTQNGGDDFGYNEYPHNNEPFYIQLDYEDGINKILGLELYFRYMQSEAEWSRSKGEIENVKWSGGLGFSRCGSQSGLYGTTWTKGLCDGGGFTDLRECHKDTNTGGKTHYHEKEWVPEEKPEGAPEWWTPSPPSKNHHLDDLSSGCNNYETHYKKCDEDSEDCEDDECDHEHDGDECEECGFAYYLCLGHKCHTGTPGSRKCTHGYYGDHYAQFYLWLEGSCDGTTEPIQYIGTCHWAWRYYYEVTKRFDWDIDITTSLAGDVWLDIDAQKDEANANVVDGDKEGAEHGVDNVLVTVKLYQDGKEVKEAIFHDDEGKALSWPIITENGGHYQVDRIEAPGTAGGSNCFYVVEFEYDGQVYESTVFLQNGGGDDTAQQYMDAFGSGYENKSMAVERSPERESFNNSFSEISGGSPMGADYSTTGYSPGGDIQYKPSEGKMKEVSEELSRDSDQDLRKSEFISAATEDHENMQANWKGSYGRYKMTAYTHYEGDICGNASSDDYKLYYPLDDEGTAYGSGDIRYKLNEYRGDTSKTGRNYIDEYMLHINLGLKKRKETDISLLKDLYKMTIVVNEQEIVQNFNCLGPSPDGSETVTIKYNDNYKTLKKVLEDRRTAITTNNLGLYNTDVAYNSKSRYKNAIGKVQDIKKDTELRVFATYAVRVYNNSDTNDVIINELTDYYDPTYTLIDEGQPVYNLKNDGVYASIVKEDLERTEKLVVDKPYYRILNTQDSYDTISWKPTKKENTSGNFRTGILNWSDQGTSGDMKKSTTNSLQGQKLGINEYVEIFTTYEINSDGFEDIRNNTDINITMDEAIQKRSLLTGEKDNIAEVSEYSTYYSDKDVEGDFYRGYVINQISGKIDKDSAPDNIVTNDIKNNEFHEDDTCRAIPLNIQIEDAQREMYGCVFEDKKTKDLGSYGVNVGDGIYKSGDVLVPKVKVSMFEVISLADCTGVLTDDISLNDLEYYYEVPIDFYNIDEGEVITTASSNSKGGNYYIKGFLPADYVLRFDYGTQADSNADLYSIDKDGKINTESDADIIKYNGQDYENTSFLSNITYTNKSEDGITYTCTAINDKYLNLRDEDMKTVDNKPGIKAVTQKDDSPQYSVARDNEARRMVVNAFSRNIENDRGEMLRDRRANNDLYIKATQMFAETPIMQIEINQPKDLNEDTNLDAKDNKKVDVVKTIDGRTIKLMDQEYSIKNINFGLEERAKTDIRLEQYIESIYLMKEDDIIFSATLNEDGSVITDNKDNKHLDKLTYLTHEQARTSNQQGFYAISVEDDYLNGLSMNIEYSIKIINESEVDFTGYLNKYNTPAKIIELASVTPTTEAYTRETINLLNKDNGMATNATLVELFKLVERDPDTAILGDLLKSDITNGNNVKERDTIRPDIIVYGKYVGTYYYENTLNESGKKSLIKQYKWSSEHDIEITYQMDQVVKTTVDQLIDYIDTNASYDLSTQNFENYAWDLSGNIKNTGERRTIPTLNELVSESSYRAIIDNNSVDKSNIYDRKGNALVTDVSSNIVIAKNNKITKFNNISPVTGEGKATLSGKDATERANTYLTQTIDKAWVKYREKEVKSKDNRALTIELEPQKYNSANSKSEMWIITAKTTASDTDANNMKFDNLVEVLVYSNPTGRRDVYSVPGNAMALASQGEATAKQFTGREIGLWKAGYNSKEWWKGNGAPDLSTSTTDEEYKKIAAEKWAMYPEDDAYAPEFVTIIAPTGITLREYIRNVIIPLTILVVILIIMVGTFGVKQVKIYRRKDEF